MTKAEIIAELRRSAREDWSPLNAMDFPAWNAQCGWRRRGEWFRPYEDLDTRTFLLLVACALEDE